MDEVWLFSKIFWKVSTSNQRLTNNLHNFAQSNYSNVHRNVDAISVLKRAIELDPTEVESETSYAIVQLASLTGGMLRDSMSTIYVRDLFNGYATRFDDDLCNNLSYKGHEQVSNEIKSLCVSKNMTIFGKLCDLGCGTGLCGPLLRPYALELVGIDVSPQMLFKAKQRSVYDNLELMSIQEFLRVQPAQSIDCLVAADVFIYIGDLEDLFSVARRALSPDGFLVFTIEEIANSFKEDMEDKKAEGVYLLASGRFGHSQEYIINLANRQGFKVLKSLKTVLRTQGGNPVDSRTIVLSPIEM